MLPTRSSRLVVNQSTTGLSQSREETNSTEGSKEMQDAETHNELHTKPEWIVSWLLHATAERRIPDNEQYPFPGTKVSADGNSYRTEGALLDGIALRNVLLRKKEATVSLESSGEERVLPCSSTYPPFSLESVDSITSGMSLSSFRIGANRETPTSIQDIMQQDRLEKKLLAIGALENCTKLMQSITIGRGPLPDPTHAAIGQALSNPDAISIMRVAVATVSLGVDFRSSRALHHLVQQRVKTVSRRERQLKDLKERRFRESRNPEVVYLEQNNEQMERTIKSIAAENFKLKRTIREVAIELGHLREAEKDATVTVRRLYDCKDKYIKTCDENRDLNKTIQKLQGGVRVLCQLSKLQRHSIGCLSSPNRGEVALQLKQKAKVFTVDRVVTGPPSTSSLKDDCRSILTSVLDGFDAKVVTVGSHSCDFEDIEDEGSFVGTLDCMITTLLDSANARFYHESFVFEFEVLLMNSTENIQLVERTNLITAMVGEDDHKGFTTAATTTTITTTTLTSPIENCNKVRELLTTIFSREALQDVQRDAHVVLRLKVQRRHKPTNAWSTSEITFIQVNASTNYNRWMQDPEVSGMISALTKISAGDLDEDTTLLQQPLLQELYRPTNNRRLHLLFVQLENEPVYEKTNLAALTMCNDIIQARAIKDSNNAWTARGHKKIAQLEKAILEKDKQINGMTKQREQVDQRKGTLESDIEQLKTQISALKEAKGQVQKSQKDAPSKSPRTPKKDQRLDCLTRSARVVNIKERETSKQATNARTQASRIPLPSPTCSPSKYERLLRADGALALTIKTHVKTEERTMVTEIRRPSKSKLSRPTRDSRN